MKLASVFFLTLAALLFCLDARAFAGGYGVAYAIDVGGKTASGKLESCKYDEACEIVLDEIKLKVSILRGLCQDVLQVSLDGPWRNCCFFEDGDNVVGLDWRKSMHRMTIYEGRKRMGSELIRNPKLGALYLNFLERQR